MPELGRAALTLTLVLLAYALIAELPPQTGLYAAIVAAVIGALWGSSFHLHTGPTNAASLLVLKALRKPDNTGPICSTANANRPRKSSGAV